jgi:hypothetical protein
MAGRLIVLTGREDLYAVGEGFDHEDLHDRLDEIMRGEYGEPFADGPYAVYEFKAAFEGPVGVAPSFRAN